MMLILTAIRASRFIDIHAMCETSVECWSFPITLLILWWSTFDARSITVTWTAENENDRYPLDHYNVESSGVIFDTYVLNRISNEMEGHNPS